MKSQRIGVGQKHIFGKFKYYKYPDPNQDLDFPLFENRKMK